MGNRLSHSAVTKFQHCPTAYSLHYNKRIRTTRSHAALNFGTAIDRGITALLEGKENPEAIFTKEWLNQSINGVETYLPTCIDIVYAEADFDKDLVNLEELGVGFVLTLDEVLEAIKYKEDKGFENIPDEIKKICNIGYWLTLHEKGLLMIEAFRKKILPKLTKVHSTQEEISLENDEGDKIVGFVDLVAEMEEQGNVILDIKTSARDYKEHSAAYSAQLTLYMNALSEKYNTRKAGFLVLSKQIIKNKTKICSKCSYDGSGGMAKTCDQESLQMVEGKKGPSEKMVRCHGDWTVTMKPEARVQIIVSEIAQAAEDLVMSNIDDINSSIKSGIFTKNLSKCTDSYGRNCEFLDLCYRGSMENLTIAQEKK
jgi:hypothetical protein